MINFKTSVWEDNIGALSLAKLEPGQITPTSKHYAVKYHCFRSQLKPNNIKLRIVDTKEQKADILSKGLGKDPFERIRRLLYGPCKPILYGSSFFIWHLLLFILYLLYNVIGRCKS